jgi:hypothetical protein
VRWAVERHLDVGSRAGRASALPLAAESRLRPRRRACRARPAASRPTPRAALGAARAGGPARLRPAGLAAGWRGCSSRRRAPPGRRARTPRGRPPAGTRAGHDRPATPAHARDRGNGAGGSSPWSCPSRSARRAPPAGRARAAGRSRRGRAALRARSAPSPRKARPRRRSSDNPICLRPMSLSCHRTRRGTRSRHRRSRHARTGCKPSSRLWRSCEHRHEDAVERAGVVRMHGDGENSDHGQPGDENRDAVPEAAPTASRLRTIEARDPPTGPARACAPRRRRRPARAPSAEDRRSRTSARLAPRPDACRPSC